MGDFWAKTERGGKNYYIAKEFLTTVQGSTRTAAAQAAAAETVAAAPVESAAAETAHGAGALKWAK